MYEISVSITVCLHFIICGTNRKNTRSIDSQSKYNLYFFKHTPFCLVFIDSPMTLKMGEDHQNVYERVKFNGYYTRTNHHHYHHHHHHHRLLLSAHTCCTRTVVLFLKKKNRHPKVKIINKNWGELSIEAIITL